MSVRAAPVYTNLPAYHSDNWSTDRDLYLLRSHVAGPFTEVGYILKFYYLVLIKCT